MEDKEVLLFEAVFDKAQAETNVVGFKKQLLDLKDAGKLLNDTWKAGKIDRDAYVKSLNELDKATAAAKSGLRDTTKELQQNAKAVEAAEGSVDQMRAKLSLMTDQYNALPAAIRDGTKEGKAFTAEIKETSDKIKEASEAIGNHKDSVGDYAKGVLESTQGTATFAEKIDEFKTKLAGAKEGLEAAKFGLTGLKGAIAATGIGLLLLALNLLYSYLTNTKEGAEKVARVMRTVGSTVEFFTDKVSAVGKVIFDAFASGEAIEKFGNLIKENLTNRVDGLKETLVAIQQLDLKQVGLGLLKLFTGIDDAPGKVAAINTELQASIDKNEALFQANKKLEDSERELNIQRAQSTKEIKALQFTADDSTVSIAKRIAAAQKAFDIENAITKKQLALQRQRVSLIEQEGTAKDGVDDDKLAEAKIKLADIEAQSLEAQKKINARRIDLTNQANSQRINAEISTLNEGLRLLKDRGFQTLEIESQLLSKQLQLSLVGVVKGSQEEKALRIKYKTDLATLILNDTIAENERLNRVEEDSINTRLSLVRKGTLEEINLNREAIKLREFDAEATARLTIKNAQELEAKLASIHAKAAEERREQDRNERQLQINEYLNHADRQSALAKIGSRDELYAREAQIKAAAEQELLQAGENADAIQAIYARMNRAIADAQKEFIRGRVDKVLELAGQANAALSNIVSAQIQSQQDLLNRQQDAALKSAGLSADIRGKIEEQFQEKKTALEKKAAESRRRIATVENIINTASALVTALKEPFPYDLIKSALVITTGAAQQAVIASQKFGRGGQVPDQKLAQGGMVNGPSHAEGGVKYQIGRQQVELEGGEGVINKWAMRIPWVRNQASQLNQVAGNGVSFDAHSRPNWKETTSRIRYRGPVRMAMGGVTPTPAPGYDQQVRALAEVIASMPNPVVDVQRIRGKVDNEVAVENAADY